MTALTDAIYQNTRGNSEGHPLGVPTSYSWYSGGGGGGSPPPSNFTSVAGWGQIYPEVGQPVDSNATVQIANFQTYVHLTNGTWVLVQDEATQGIGGAHYLADFSGNASTPWHETMLSDGSVSVDAPQAGYNDHFWPGTRGTYAAGTVDGVFVEVDMKTNDPNAHLVANVGADWWLSQNAGFVNGFSNNPGAGMSQWVELSTTYKTLYFSSLSAAQLQADPPPGLHQSASSVTLGNTDAYSILGTGDFNGDGTTDIVWQNKTSGQAEIWTMSGGKMINDTPIGNLFGYNLLGTGDFNGNGTSDIIWQNKSSGQMEIWSMSNGHVVGDTMFSDLSGYNMLGTGDFSHDGSTDIIWQSKATGGMEIWNMKGGAISTDTQFGNLSAYNLIGTSDLNHDGNTDIIWQNKASGKVDVWFMGNGGRIADYDYGSMQGFKLLATGDYNHDGNNDLLWQNTSTKEIFDWIISPTTGRPTGDVTSFGALAPNFNVIGSGDFFHDGAKDLVLQNTVTHQTEIWDPQHGVVAQHDFLIA